MRFPWILHRGGVVGCRLAAGRRGADRVRLERRLGTVSVIDTATDKVTATFKVGGKPRGIALSPDGKRLYLSDQTANALLVVDAATRRDARAHAARQFARRHLSVERRQAGSPPPIEEDDQVMLVDTATRQGRAEASRCAARIPSTRCSAPTASGSTSAARKPTASTSSTSRKGEVVQVGEGRRPPARHRFPARWQARLRRGGERGHGQRLRCRDA